MDLRSGKVIENSTEERSDSEEGTSGENRMEEQSLGFALLLQKMTEMEEKAVKREEKAEKREEKAEQTMKLLEDKLERIMETNVKMEKKMHETILNLKDNVKEDIKKLEEKLMQKTQKVEERNNILQKRVEEEEKENKKKWIQTQNEMEMVKENITEVRTSIEKNYKEINEKIETFEQAITKEEIQVKLNPNVLIEKDEFKYFGDMRTHPVVYIRRLREKTRKMNFMELKMTIRNSMKGRAEDWYNLIDEEYENITQFEEMFLAYFWGDLAQGKVREELYMGKYDETKWMTREQYAMKKINLAKYLEPIMEENDIVKYVARHFEENIREVIAVNEITTVKRLLQYLKRVDDLKTPRRKNFIQQNNIRWDGGRTRYTDRNLEYKKGGEDQTRTTRKWKSEDSTSWNTNSGNGQRWRERTRQDTWKEYNNRQLVHGQNQRLDRRNGYENRDKFKQETDRNNRREENRRTYRSNNIINEQEDFDKIIVEAQIENDSRKQDF